MNFKDRESAAYLLLEKLKLYKDEHPIVAGIPRGAMPMAKIIADGLGGELTVLLVHKIPSAENREFAIGCVGLSGHIHRNSYVYEAGISDAYIESTAKSLVQSLQERQKAYGVKIPSMTGRTVIIVDDGIATGATTKCAIHEARSQNPEKIVLAAAVSAVDSAYEIKSLVDDFVVLATPRNFFSVGQFFSSFPQVSDQEVLDILHGSSLQGDVYESI